MKKIIEGDYIRGQIPYSKVRTMESALYLEAQLQNVLQSV